MGQAWQEQAIPGLYTVGMDPFEDSRGVFHKILVNTPPAFEPLKFDEIYWSSSQAGVARGMHFQVPPHHGRKLVFVTSGTVVDLVVDLRVDSPTFQRVWEQQLNPESQGVLIPAGCAHGFLVMDSPAVLVYAQEGVYNRECDTGVNLRSLPITRDITRYELSDRDQNLPHITEFDSPFTFDSAMFAQWGRET